MHIKKRMLTVSGILAALTLGIGGGVGIPSILATRTDILRIIKDQATLDDRFAMHKIMSKNIADIASAEKRVGPLSAMALQDGSELDFVTAIENAATSASVKEKLELITANQVILSPWEREVPIKISVTGPFKSVMSFINEIERMPYLVVVNGVQFIPLTSDENGGSVTANISANVYSLGAAAPDFVHGKADSLTATDTTAAGATKP